jgi:hypothetical protein
MAGEGAYRADWLRLHPIGEVFGVYWFGLPLADVAHLNELVLKPGEEEYLSQFLPPAERPVAAPGHHLQIQQLKFRAVSTNLRYTAIATGSISLLVVAVLCLGSTMHSTWAADYLTRSGRGPIARAVCYLELYPLVVFLLICSVVATIMGLILIRNGLNGWPRLVPWVIFVGCGSCLVGFAHIGVIRRWHPVTRGLIYLVCIGLGVALIVLASHG